MGWVERGLDLSPEHPELLLHRLNGWIVMGDLGVRREVGMRVNLYGTRHVLDFAAACEGLERFHYFSTCYVSGRHPGIFHEHDLERGQAFSNWYEETKYQAEREVRERMQEGLRATIYRPSIVVGDSRTGATRKYDGPYGMIRWMLRQRRTVPIPGIRERIPRVSTWCPPIS